MNIQQIKSKNLQTLVLVTLFGFVLRIWVSYYGYNSDFSSWEMNLKHFKAGESIYTFGNFAYSPAWVYILYLIDLVNIPISNNNYLIENLPGSVFRLKLVIFLSLIDFFIFYNLYKNYSLKIGLLFFFNPISIWITGFHNAFDNIPIFLAFLSIIFYEKNKFKDRIIFPLLLLSLSIVVKHILIFFPIWWACKEKKLLNKILILTVPYLIFAFSFIQFLPNEFSQVFHKFCCAYKFSNGPFWGMFGPKIIHMYFDLQTLFSIILIVLGFLIVNKNLKESFLLYLMAIVAFSSMTYTQYLAIPLIALAIIWNRKCLFYTILVILLYLVDGDQLSIQYLREPLSWNLRLTRIGYYPIILTLLVIFIERLLGEKKFRLYLKKIFYFITKKIKRSINFKI
jgi:hypothetical protein